MFILSRITIISVVLKMNLKKVQGNTHKCMYSLAYWGEGKSILKSDREANGMFITAGSSYPAVMSFSGCTSYGKSNACSAGMFAS